MLHRQTSIRTSLLKSRPAAAALRLCQLTCAASVPPLVQLNANLTFRNLPRRVAAIVNCADWPAVAAAPLLAVCCLPPGCQFLCHQDCKATLILLEASWQCSEVTDPHDSPGLLHAAGQGFSSSTVHCLLAQISVLGLLQHSKAIGIPPLGHASQLY